MSDLRGFVQQFLTTRQVTGRPLYTYQLDEEDYAQLTGRVRAELRHLLRQPAPDPQPAAAFVMWAAESARRAPAWHRWEDILAPLGRLDIQTPDLYPQVEAGLRFWGRSLLKRADRQTAYLGTVVCEGGLPLALVRKEHSHLQRYSRGLLHTACQHAGRPERLREEALRLADILPRTLRQEIVFELFAELIASVWAVHEEVGEVEDTLEVLRRRDPAWRERFPLRLDDEQAENLLSGLLAQARRVSHGLADEPMVHRGLQRCAEGDWRVVAWLEMPGTCDVDRLRGMLRMTEDSRADEFMLHLCTSDGESRPVGRAMRVRADADEGGSHEVWSIDPWYGHEQHLLGVAAASTVEILADDGSGRALGEIRGVPRGGTALSQEQPWVFAVPSGDETIGRLLADGGCRTRRQEVLIVLPEGARMDSEATIGEATVIGSTRATARRVLRCTGTVVIRGEADDRWRVRCDAEDEHAPPEFRLIGTESPFGGGRDATYLGIPQVYRLAGTRRAETVALERLQWRPCLSGAAWRPGTAGLRSARGRVEIRVATPDADGIPEFGARLRFTVLPPELLIQHAPAASGRGGRIEIGGLDGGACTVLDAGMPLKPEVHLREDQTAILEVTDLPPSACSSPPPWRIELSWRGFEPVLLSLPAPLRTASFVDADGRPHTGTDLTLADLGRLRVIVVTPANRKEHFAVTGQLIDPAGTPGQNLHHWNRKIEIQLPLLHRGKGFHEAHLRALKPAIERALSHAPGLDIQVRLEVSTQSRDQRLVRRHPATLSVHHESHRVSLNLPDDAFAAYGGEHRSDFEVCAFPLLQPEQVDEKLPEIPVSESTSAETATTASAGPVHRRGSVAEQVAEPGVETDPEPRRPRFRFDTSGRKTGPWILYARRDGRCITRPVLWTVHHPEPPTPDADDLPLGSAPGAPETSDPLPTDLPKPPPIASTRRTTLAEAIAVDDAQHRQAVLHASLAALPAHPDHADWELLMGLARRARDLPASAFDPLRRLAEHPRTMIQLLLRQGSPADILAVRDLQRALPLRWELLPTRDWNCELLAYLGHLRSSLLRCEGEATAEAELRKHVERLADQLRGAGVGLQVIASWLPTLAYGKRPELLARAAAAERDLCTRLRALLDATPLPGDDFRQAGDLESAPAMSIDEQPRFDLGDLRHESFRSFYRAPQVAAWYAAGHQAPEPLILLQLERMRGLNPHYFDSMLRPLLDYAYARTAMQR